MMNPLFSHIREMALEVIALCPQGVFYHDMAWALDRSRQFFNTDPLVGRLKAFVGQNLEDDFGHGWEHAKKVAVEAGALVLAEGKRDGVENDAVRHRMQLVQCGGLLHDIKRKKKNHAVLGAKYARRTLSEFAVGADDIDHICLAIRNHEAFKATVPVLDATGRFVSDCLYDADKFRWGPDNFKNTLWEMVSFANPTLREFVSHYPQGMAGLSRIKSTFRSFTGRRYGPDFIDTGIAIGRELLARIRLEYAAELVPASAAEADKKGSKGTIPP